MIEIGKEKDKRVAVSKDDDISDKAASDRNQVEDEDQWTRS